MGPLEWISILVLSLLALPRSRAVVILPNEPIGSLTDTRKASATPSPPILSSAKSTTLSLNPLPSPLTPRRSRTAKRKTHITLSRISPSMAYYTSWTACAGTRSCMLRWRKRGRDGLVKLEIP